MWMQGTELRLPEQQVLSEPITIVSVFDSHPFMDPNSMPGSLMRQPSRPQAIKLIMTFSSVASPFLSGRFLCVFSFLVYLFSSVMSIRFTHVLCHPHQSGKTSMHVMQHNEEVLKTGLCKNSKEFLIISLIQKFPALKIKIQYHLCLHI